MDINNLQQSKVNQKFPQNKRKKVVKDNLNLKRNDIAIEITCLSSFRQWTGKLKKLAKKYKLTYHFDIIVIKPTYGIPMMGNLPHTGTGKYTNNKLPQNLKFKLTISIS